MGVRLYPNTQNVASLEILAKVPAGTAAKLAEIEKRHAEELKAVTADYYELGYSHWQEINDDTSLGDYSAFLLYGWGKFDGAGVAESYAGNLNNPAEIKLLFQRNGIDADVSLTEGVHWC